MALVEMPLPVSRLGLEQRRNVSEVASTPRIEKAKNILIRATDEQIIAVDSGRFQKYTTCVYSQEYFDAFIQDPLFLETYKLAKQEAMVMESDEEFVRGFKGVMFQNLAYLVLSGLDGKVILPEKDVFEIVKAINPNNFTRENAFGMRGIDHRFVPDGFVVSIKGRQPKISQILEYSLAQCKPRRIRQEDGFRHLSRELGDAACNPSFVQICPVPGKDLIFESPGATKFLMPFTLNEFVDEFLRDRVYSGQIDGEKTLAALRSERRQGLSSAEPSLS
jgi:hypothetical protein